MEEGNFPWAQKGAQIVSGYVPMEIGGSYVMERDRVKRMDPRELE